MSDSSKLERRVREEREAICTLFSVDMRDQAALDAANAAILTTQVATDAEVQKVEGLAHALCLLGIECVDGKWYWTHASGRRYECDSVDRAAATLLRSYRLNAWEPTP